MATRMKQPKVKTISTRPETYARIASRKGRLSFTEFQEVLLNVWDRLTDDERMRQLTSPPNEGTTATN